MKLYQRYFLVVFLIVLFLIFTSGTVYFAIKDSAYSLLMMLPAGALFIVIYTYIQAIRISIKWNKATPKERAIMNLKAEYELRKAEIELEETKERLQVFCTQIKNAGGIR
jgi:hypothetical protein